MHAQQSAEIEGFLIYQNFKCHGRKKQQHRRLQNPGITPASLLATKRECFLWENHWIEHKPGTSLRLGHILDEFHAISTLCLDNYIL